VHLQTLHHPKWASGIMHTLLVPEVVLGDLSTSLSQTAVTYSRMKFG
jgi:hypothetical protein